MFPFIAISVAIKEGGIMAAVYPEVIAAVIERFAIGYKLARTLGLQWQDKGLFGDVFEFGAAAAIAAIPTWRLGAVLAAHHPAFVLGACSAVYAIFYLGAAFLFRIPTPEELIIIGRYSGTSDPLGKEPLTV